MVHLIFIVVLAGWHNLLLSARIAIGKLDQLLDLPLRNALLLNTSVKSKKPAWENPAAASTYTSRSVTVPSPATTPSAPQYYLGRKTTFSTTKQKVIRLQTGGGSRYFIKPHSTDFYDQPKASLPPPAPNISPPCHSHRLPSNQGLLLVDTQIPQQRDTIPRTGGGHIHNTEPCTTKSSVQPAKPLPLPAPNIRPPTTATQTDPLRIDDPMVTWRGNDHSGPASQLQERHDAELALQQKMEKERKKSQQKKLQRKEERRKEEEEHKFLKDAAKERCNINDTTTVNSMPGPLVSPSDVCPKDVEMEDPNLNKNLFGFMNREGDEENKEVNRSPPKNKPKKSSKAAAKQAPAVKIMDRPIPTTNAVKGALKAGFKDSQVHNFPLHWWKPPSSSRGNPPCRSL
jgi:hypothetical protein